MRSYFATSLLYIYLNSLINLNSNMSSGSRTTQTTQSTQNSAEVSTETRLLKKTDLLEFDHFYLMGIKGVAMTSLAQILVAAGKTVTGCDVAQDFVTAQQLKRLNLTAESGIDIGFKHQLPEETQVVIYTSAHQGPNNPLVRQAQQRGLSCYSQAEALAYFFNRKQGIAVCGVGGKSTTSAMIAWILTRLQRRPSYSVGVGDILGLDQTGAWRPDSAWFVAEADEYVTDPDAARCGEKITPRFSYLRPQITICTNLAYDHPDVYRDLNHTKQVFADFFLQIKPGGVLIYNADCSALTQLVQQLKPQLKQRQIKLQTFGTGPEANLQLQRQRVWAQSNQGQLVYRQLSSEELGEGASRESLRVNLNIPGNFNLLNALAAGLACQATGIELKQALSAVSGFKSTMRRFELVKYESEPDVIYLDDYAHHPHEIEKTIQALRSWYPKRRIVLAFQPHTYSRTKQLFDQFVSALASLEGGARSQAQSKSGVKLSHESGLAADSGSSAKAKLSPHEKPRLILLDIFPSAREEPDPSISSQLLAQQVSHQAPQLTVVHLASIDDLAQYCQQHLQDNDVFMTMGAGDVYQVYKQL
jgi:UDP-N-acetylmuramate--alanine ligase